MSWLKNRTKKEVFVRSKLDPDKKDVFFLKNLQDKQPTEDKEDFFSFLNQKEDKFAD